MRALLSVANREGISAFARELASMGVELYAKTLGLIGAGAHNLAIRAPTNRRLEKGDLIVGEITPCYRGYFAQLCRTFILGEPSELQLRKYDMLIAAQDAGFAVGDAVQVASTPTAPTSASCAAGS